VLQQLDEEGCKRVADVLRELPLDSVYVVGQAHSFVTEVQKMCDCCVALLFAHLDCVWARHNFMLLFAYLCLSRSIIHLVWVLQKSMHMPC
jgi:hypothetical protein